MAYIASSDRYGRCRKFFTELAIALGNGYEILDSCNKDISRYLIPKGTADQVTYYGKPDKSFRISDHWNWYSSIMKCSNENYIQCLSVDAPWSFRRPSKGKASKPRFCVQVCVIGDDGKYHCVYGERFDRKTKTWEWVEADPREVAAMYNA